MSQSVHQATRQFVKADNLMRWIEALISGDYLKHIPYYGLYDPEADSYTATGLAAKVLNGKYIGEFAVCEDWFYNTFGLPVSAKRIDDLSSAWWTFAQVAEYLVSFLPANGAKYELQAKIVRKLVNEHGRADFGENVTLGIQKDGQ